MSTWNDQYKSKLVSIEEAVRTIKSNDDVIVGQCASEPQGCMDKFHLMKDSVENVRVFSVLTLKPYEFYVNPEMKGHFELASWFHAPGSRGVEPAGELEVPLHLRVHVELVGLESEDREDPDVLHAVLHEMKLIHAALGLGGALSDNDIVIRLDRAHRLFNAHELGFVLIIPG